MVDVLEIDDSIYQFITNVDFKDKENIKDLVEYVHYKALLELITYIIENNNGVDLDFMLTDYVEIISRIQIITNKIKLKLKNEKKDDG